MVLGRIFPKITKFYLDGSPAEAEIAYPDKVRRVHIRLGGQEEQITAGPEGVITSPRAILQRSKLNGR